MPPKPSLRLALLLLSGSTAVHAERWEFTPTLMLREIYSDNIALVETDPQADWVTEVTPGFALRGQNDLLRLNFSANAQNLYYRDGAANDGDKSQSNPQLQLSSTTTLIPGFLYFDANGNAGQRIISQNSQLSYDNIALSGDRTDYASYTLAPYIKFQSRSGINLEARAERGVNRYDSEAAESDDYLSDANSENYRFVLDNSAMLTGLHWRLYANRRYLDREDDELSDPDFRQAQLDLSYQASGALALIARAGRSENTLGGYDNDRNGNYSAGGFRWSPSRRLNLSVMSGSNYRDAEINWKPSRRTDLMVGYRDSDVGLIIGPSWRASFKMRGRQIYSTLGYDEEVTTEQQLVLDGTETVPLRDPQGNIVIDPVTNQPIIVIRNRYAIADDEFERHRATFTLGWQGRKSLIALTASQEERTYLLRSELDSTAESLGLNVKFPVGGGLDWVGQYRAQRNTFTEDAAEEFFWLASLGLRMNFSSRSYAALTVQQAEQDSERDSRSYEEGRVIAEMNMRF